MENQQRQRPQLQGQLEALGDEIQRIRDEFGSAITESNRLRLQASNLSAQANNLNGRAIANDNYIACLVERVQRAEFTQQALLTQATSASVQTPGGITKVETLGGYGYIGDPSSDPPPSSYAQLEGYSGMIPPPPGPSQSSEYSASSSLRPPPFTDPNSLTTPRATSARLAPIHGQPLQPKKPLGSKDNADFLPMVIENLAVAKKHWLKLGKQGNCHFVLERKGNQVKKCKRPTFTIKCFQEGHFHYCRRHMRIIPADEPACTPVGRGDCIPTFWEWREDWEMIVDQAFKAGNLGKKDLTHDELKQALFPPQYYPHRYM